MYVAYFIRGYIPQTVDGYTNAHHGPKIIITELSV